MKTFFFPLLTCFFMFTIIQVSAQQKDSTHIIYKDTINLRGYVYYDNGRPASGTRLTSTNKELQYDRFELFTVTDTAGYFELKGAKAEDTIMVRAPFVNRGKYFNSGARYLIITLPTPTPSQLHDTKSMSVIASRINSKAKTRFRIQSYTAPLNEVFESTEVLPEYPGGMDRFYTYIHSKLFYPKQAIDANIEGQVEGTFTVMKDGALNRIKIIKGLGYGCDEVVLQLLKQCRKWNPGKFYGRAVEVTYTVSIDFKLTDK